MSRDLQRLALVAHLPRTDALPTGTTAGTYFGESEKPPKTVPNEPNREPASANPQVQGAQEPEKGVYLTGTDPLPTGTTEITYPLPNSVKPMGGT